MKKFLIILTSLIISMITLPIMNISRNKNNIYIPTVVKTENENKLNNTDKPNFKLLIKSQGKIIDISYNDYIFGCVAAEMPISYETEALKAQAVAAYTYALYKAQSTKNDYDLTDDYNTDQAYLDVDTLKEKWGDNFQTYKDKITSAIDSVKGEKITYNGEVILAVYHSVSSGKTVSSKNVWGKDLPYLISVDSSFDKKAPNFETKLEISKEDMNDKLSKYLSDPNFEIPIGDIKTTKDGVVETLSIFNNKIDGYDFYNTLNINSRTYNVSYLNDIFTVNVYGNGHGVGMSQYGANCMAKQGSSYKEILLHYYSNCKITK